MPAPHVPSFNAIDRVTDETVRFYAIAGVLVSLSAALDLNLFDIFAIGLGLTEERAAPIFYAVKSEDARAAMADQAMSGFIAQDAALLDEWKALFKRMGKASEHSRFRNLVAHNPVQKRIILIPQLNSAPPHPMIHHDVRQDEIQVRAKKRGDMSADYAELRKACVGLARASSGPDGVFAAPASCMKLPITPLERHLR